MKRNLFRIECFIQDNKIGEALRSLDGFALDLKVLPVRNAAAVNGSVVAGSGSTAEEAICGLIKNLRDTKKDTLLLTDARDACVDAGLSRSGHVYAINKLMSAGALRKHRTKRGVYQILSK